MDDHKKQVLQDSAKEIYDSIIIPPELEDVVKDLSYALEDAERHGQKLPLLVLLDNGSTEEDVAALRHSKVYGIESIVVDGKLLVVMLISLLE